MSNSSSDTNNYSQSYLPFKQIEYDKGGPWVAIPRKAGAWKPNARLTLPDGYVHELHVEDMQISFEAGGTTAQSQTYNQWFPRNYTQPQMSISGTMRDNATYNRLALTVRASQYQAISQGGALTRLHIHPGKVNTVAHAKGNHKAFAGDGYITTISAGAERFVQAPPFQFNFVVANSDQNYGTGIFSDTSAAGSQLLSWTQIFDKSKKNGDFYTDPGYGQQANSAAVPSTPKPKPTPSTVSDTISAIITGTFGGP